MKLIMVLALAAFTGSNANIVWQNQPKQQLDMVKDAFWDYVAKATFTARNSLDAIRQSELGKEVNSFISESTDAVNKLTMALDTQVTPMTQDLLAKFSQEAELLRARVEKDVSTVSTLLHPYAEELKADLQRQVEELRRDMAPYTEATMDAESLKASLLQRSEELRGFLEKKIQELQTQMTPYSEELKQNMEENLREFEKTLIPLTQNIQNQVVQKTQEIQQNMAPYERQLKKVLDVQAEDVREQLADLWKSFTKMIQ
ncbi:apolipoprotein A-IV a isoform X2 [Lampris incognitus]|uniref:apolipoprotein A-IV a isoform X2 n=1 Tax=Lampris incognitus TaxID=2546036 RepID=UPI0024B52F1A|nr:apolipoprotein A-IV a isoform X2 [Lampris incognitus]